MKVSDDLGCIFTGMPLIMLVSHRLAAGIQHSKYSERSISKMNKLAFAEDLGKKLVMSQHEYYGAVQGEDLDHITNLKRIILTISDYLKSDGISEDKAEGIAENLKGLSKTLFVNGCIPQREDEDEEMIREESELWFDYIWKNGEYPR
jgi:hypothetical protein